MREAAFVLAIDMGSSWCKAAYVDATGQTVSEGRVYTRGGPPFGHDAAELARSWTALVEAIHKANDGLRMLGRLPSPDAIAISCRKAPGVWLDGNNEPVNVPRAAIEGVDRDDIDDSYAADVWGDSDPFAYGYGLDLIGNTRWLRHHFPDECSRVRKACLEADRMLGHEPRGGGRTVCLAGGRDDTDQVTHRRLPGCDGEFSACRYGYSICGQESGIAG
jgi:sugar (pentulose or hexulose) kinase